MPILAILLCWFAAILGYIKADPAVWVAYGFLNPVLFLLPRITYELLPSVRKRLTAEWLKNIERVGLGVLLVNIPGSIYLHDLGIQYDRFLHFSAAFLVFFGAFLLLSPVFTKLPEKSEKNKALAISSVATFIGLFGMELIQWSSDQLFGTRLFFDVTQRIQQDVTEDILFGFAGLLLALLIFRHSGKVWRQYAEASFK